MILPEKSSGISLSCQTLRRSPSCPLFRRSSQKERIPRQTPRRHALISQSLRWHYPNQVRSKIYLPLSLSHKLPLALFFSVFQYSTHLSRCQTSTAYCSLHSHRRRYCSLRSQQHAFAMHRIYGNRINSRGMSRVFCDLRSQKTPRGILPVNSNPETFLIQLNNYFDIKNSLLHYFS